MAKFDRKSSKKRGIKRFFLSFKYAGAGIKYALAFEQSFFIHSVITLIVVIAGIIIKIKQLEWILLLFSIALVLAAELINSSIEATIDLITDTKRPLAKIAKDTAGGAVLILAIMSALIGLIIFVPYIIELF